MNVNVSGSRTFPQVRNNETKKSFKCPAIIVSDKNTRFDWEDKPLLVVKIVRRKRCRQSKDAPQDISPFGSSGTEKVVPAGSGLILHVLDGCK